MTATTEVPAPGTYYTCVIAEFPDLNDQLDAAAKALRISLRDGTYRDGYERELANWEIAYNPEDEDRILWTLLCDHMSCEFMDVTLCLIDNAQERSYDVVVHAAKLFYDEIHAQGKNSALEQMLVHEISERSQRIEVRESL